ncbi:MAG TPA: isoleucine--tRNA ligase [Gaiellaceae bacterium]|nr:isoleucine--tRNA ligase [Gaiellaceae bacterium]
MAEPFQPLPKQPDHPALELEILKVWEDETTFEQLRERNRGGKHWSFVDGPVTANKKLAIHTAWGRTLKDVFQRYKAMQGFDQRYQNGFDCQGLWVEVGVEKSLGLNSKREIEEYGLDKFARKCRELVVWSANELWRGSKRLGQWMDWGNDYFTFSDANIEYIWRFLKIVHGRGWLYVGHRSTEWCPRCGTSLSQHELSQSGVYQDRADPSLYVRLPLLDRHGEALVIWTTTPWTLPANVAGAVKPDAEYGRRDDGDWVAVARYPDDRFEERLRGEELVGWRYEGPFDTLEPGRAVEHRVIRWDEVTLEDGTGIVHIAPGCGGEDFELGRELGLPVLTPVDEAGRFYPEYGWLHGSSTGDAADQIVGDLKERGLLVEAGLYEHRYPHCWRCDTPLIFRIADDWFISVEEVRPQLISANTEVEWTPEYMGKRMEDWLRNMGDWNISRRRYFGLPLPIWTCGCGHSTVIGSKAELAERATAGIDQLEELHRPWVDNVTIRCEACGNEDVHRIPEVGDVWLDAGIVPFSTLGWQNETWADGGYATGASAGLSGADLPDHAYWEKWFPADWVSEMREQIRLWFYSQLFMSVALVGKAPFRSVLGYEKMLDERGREMHGSWGNMIDAEEAFDRMGADVMRWQFCQQPPDRNLLFGYGPAHEVQRKLLTLWNSVKFLVDYANIEGFEPRFGDLSGGPDAELRPLDRWLLARTQRLVAEATEALEAQLTSRLIDAFEAFLDDLSNWYIRRSRRRFYSYDDAAFRTLWFALVQSLRVVSPIMPFLCEHLWRNLVAGPCAEAPRSVFLAPWPDVNAALADEALLEEIAEVRRVVDLGRQARASRNLKLRQPLRQAVVYGAGPAAAHAAEIGEELRVKEVRFEAGVEARVRLKPNLPLLGPRLGKRLPAVRKALEEGRWHLEGDAVVAEGERLSQEEVLREREPVNEGWAIASEGELAVELDSEVDAVLQLEGRVLDRIRQLNELRKQEGLELTDRIRVFLPESDADLLEHADWIKDEVLAVEIQLDGAGGVPRIEKV